jgi:Fibronectin type III domain
MNHCLFKPLISLITLLCFVINISYSQDIFIDNPESINSDPVPTCLPVTNLQNISSTSTTLGFRWQHYTSIYTLDYNYELLEGATIIKSGKISNPVNCASATACWVNYTATGLTPNKTYTLNVFRNCSTTSVSTPTSINATTSPATSSSDCDTKSISAYTLTNKVSINISNYNNSSLDYTVALLKAGTVIETKTVQINGTGTVSFTNVQPCTDYLVQVTKVISASCPATWSQNLYVSTPCCGQIAQAVTEDETTNSFKLKWINPIAYPTEGFSIKIKDLQLNLLKEINVPYAIGQTNNTYPNLLNFSLLVNSSNFPAILPNKEYVIDILPYCFCISPDPTFPNQNCYSNGATTKATTNYPCAAPSSITITNITDNSIAVSFVPPVSSLNNQLKKKFLLKIFEENKTQAVASEWIGPNGFNGNTIYYQFNNLKENTNYKIKIETYCCLTTNPITQECIWTQNDITTEVLQKTLFEPCKSPKNPFVSTIAYNSITVKWTNLLSPNDRVKVEIIQNASTLQVQWVNATEPILSYTFNGLDPTTDYVVRLTSECCEAASNGCSSYLTGGTTTLAAKTPAEPSSECTQSPVTFNFIPMGDKVKIEWTPNNIPLSSTGKRFIFAGPSGTVVIDNPSSNIITGFNPGNTYNLKIRQVFDGSYDSYTKACDWYTKELTFEPPCSADINVSVKCLGIKALLFNLDKPLTNGMQLKVKYREVTEKLQQFANVNVDDFCNSTTFSNIAINPLVSQNAINNWITQVIVPNPQGKYILSGLKDCSFYELKYTIESNNVVCKSFNFQTYYHTLGSTGTGSPINKDVNENGIDDDCEGFTPPPTNSSTTNNLVKLVCGQDPPSSPETGTPYTNGKIGDIFLINSFPFEITEISKNPNSLNIYSGKGVVSIPVADQGLLVEFNSITVISVAGGIKKVISGVVKSEKDDANGIDLVKTINLINNKNNDPNAKFCGDPNDGAGLNEFGFNSKGKYGKTPPYDTYSDGDPFDNNYSPNGFDKNGNFLGDPKKKYNKCGCNAAGEAEPGTGKPCVPNCQPPYYWVAQKNETTEGLLLYALKKDKLKDDILKILNTREANNSTLLTAKNTECNAHRTVMKEAAKELEYNEALVFGPNKEWINSGMSKYFDKAPLPFKTKMGRNTNHELLEGTHIKLFYCDVEESVFVKTDKILKKLKDNSVLDLYLNSIAFQIKSMENEKAKKFIAEHKAGNPNKFIVWLAEIVDKKIEYDLKYGKITDVSTDYKKYDLSPDAKFRDWEKSTEGMASAEPSELPASKKAKFSLEDIGQIAGKDVNVMELFKIYHEQPEKLVSAVEANLQFEYEQGYNTIGGVSRAFILEAVHQKRFMMPIAGNAVGTPLSRSKDDVAKTQNVYFDNIQFTPQGATVDIYVIIDFKGYQQVFQVLNAPLSASGFKTPIKLALGSDFSFPISNVARFTLKGQPNPALAGNGTPTTPISATAGSQSPTSGENGTYIVVGCDGFGGLNLDVKIEFCRKYFVPLDDKGIELADPAKVEATFKVKVLSFDNVLIDKLSVSPFALAKNKDFQFSLKNVVLDLSDTETPAIVKFPGNYVTAFANQVAGNNAVSFTPTPAWKGFYIGEIKIKLPQKWSKPGEPAKEAFAQDFIIDEGGISGKCGVNNLLTNGNMSGWKFTIDKFELDVFHNKPVGAGMDGKIHLPILKDGEYFEYKAAMLPGNAYQFTVLPPKSGLAVDLWLADVTFTEGTAIDIEYVNDKFKASAILYGDINVHSGKIIKMDNFTFENVVISTDEAVRNPGKWGIPTVGAHVKGFDLTISEIKLTKEEKNGITTTKLNVTTSITLSKSESQSLLLNAGGNFDILGEVTINAANEQVWVYKDIQLNRFHIGMETNSFKLNGDLAFYRNDVRYGEGFYGSLFLDLTKPKTTVAVAAVFGKVKSSSNDELYKYFFVDAFVKLPKSIPLGPLGLNGLGGGISWHMKKQDTDALDLTKAPVDNAANGTPTLPVLNGPKSLTGAVYVPDDKIGLGIKIMTTFELSETPEALNGGAALEIVFKADGGISTIELNGIAHIMAKPPSIPEFQLNTEKLTNGIHAGLKLKYDFNNDILSANLKAYAYIEGKLVGCGSPGIQPEDKCKNKFLGEIDMYFNIPDKKWYIKIGRTDVKGENRIGVGFGSEKFGVMVATAYFNIGNYDIKPMPPLPSYAQELIKSSKANFSDNSVMRSSGKAFAFGADLNLYFDINAFVYARFEFNLGFDFMMAHHPGVTCANLDNSPIGVNYWYAEGQIYTRLLGDAGIKVGGKTFALGSISAASAMKGGGPNPFWAVGAAKIKYSVCFNLIKGEANVEVSFGKKCDLATESNPNTTKEESQIISSISPDKGTDKVSVIAKPLINFIVPVDIIQEGSEDLKIKTVVKKVKLLDGNNEIHCDLLISPDNMSYTLKPYRILPSNKKLMLTVEAAAYEIKSNNTLGEKLIEDNRTIEFTTEKLTTIPEENIESSYPINGMFNYYRKEDNSNKGFIKLKQEQNELFDEMPQDRSPVVQFFSEGKLITAVPFNYNSGKITFDMPNDKLSPDKVYKMDFIFAPGFDGEPQILLTQYFRVSKYESLFDKLKDVQISANNGINLSEIDEPFDKLELGEKLKPGLLSLDFSDNGWSKKVENQFYKYNGDKIELFNDNGGILNDNLVLNYQSEYSIGALESAKGVAPKVITKELYENPPALPDYRFSYRFGFNPIAPDLLQEILAYIDKKSQYSKILEACDTVKAYDKDQSCKSDSEAAYKNAKEKYTSDPDVVLPPAPKQHTFYFKYTLPTENVPTSQVEKVWNH